MQIRDVFHVKGKNRNPERCVPGRRVSRDKDQLVSAGHSDVGPCRPGKRFGRCQGDPASVDKEGRKGLEENVVWRGLLLLSK